MQKIKRECPVPWSREFLQPAGSPLDPSMFTSAGWAADLLDLRFMTLQEEADLFTMVMGVVGPLCPEDRIVYPGLMVSWMVTPRTADLSDSFVKAVSCEQITFLDAPMEGLRDLFPSCMLVDVRGCGLELYGLHMDGLFMYPSFDEDRGYAMILMVGVDSRYGLRDPLLSKLVVKGDTFADALEASAEERRILHMRWLTGLDTGEHDQIFATYEDETALLDLGVRILSLACSNQGSILWAGRTERSHGVFDFGRSDLHLSDEACSFAGSSPAAEQPIPDVLAPAAEQSISDVLAPAAEQSISTETVSEQVEALPVELALEQVEPLPVEPAPATPEADVLHQVTSEQHSYRVLELEEALDQAQAALRDLQETNAALTYHLAKAQESLDQAKMRIANLERSARFASCMLIPQTPYDALLLAEEAFSDRLAVTDGARRSARAFVKGDTAEVWRVLRDMATVLHPLIFQGESHDIARAYASKTGYELALRDRKAANADPVRKRLLSVEYGGKAHDMTPHVKGKGVKRGEALRVHFFADYESGKVVVGHCGEHLQTPQTSKI